MKPTKRPSLAGWRAVILHRPHPAVEALRRQLEALSISVRSVWPVLEDAEADVVFFDADMGHDEQFPWPAGFSPVPMIALIGSEAPGRVEWALSQGSNAHLLKPIGSTGAYSALLIAAHAYESARSREDDIRSLEGRLRCRAEVVRAVVKLMNDHKEDETAAMKRLRALAMASRVTVEEAAEAICSAETHTRKGA